MPLKIPGVAWRSLTGYDMPAVEKIAAQVHPDFFESLDVLTERQAIYFHGTYLLEVNERPAGYVLSHPWAMGSLPKLNALLGGLPEAADPYYIHHLALLPPPAPVSPTTRRSTPTSPRSSSSISVKKRCSI